MPLRVGLASEHVLVREVVRAALTDRDLAVVVLRPAEESAAGHHHPRPASTPAAPGQVAPVRTAPGRTAPRPTPRLDVGLLVSDLDRWSRLGRAGQIFERFPIPWVVLTGADEGPRWGAVLAQGAHTVLSSQHSDLQTVRQVLQDAASGGAGLGEGRVARLRASWDDLRRERSDLQARFASLTPREREVVTLLYAGDGVDRIAAHLGSAPATVRSQVKGVLRKLGVGSQIAAVATYRRMVELEELGNGLRS